MPKPPRRCALHEIPHLNLVQRSGRHVSLLPVWTGEAWDQWIRTADGDYMLVHPRELGRGDYLAKVPAAPTDLRIPFVDLVRQHMSWPSVANATNAITNDFVNFCASLSKVDLFWRERKTIGRGIDEFVRTELEYVLVVARSVLDHLHDAVRGIWAMITLTDEEAQARKKAREIPKKLTKLLRAKDGQHPTASELAASYALPPPFADFYESMTDLLFRVRGLRDGIVHHGHTSARVFVTDKGFGLAKDEPLARSAGDIWRPEHSFNEHVVSLRPLLAYLMLESVYATERAAQAVVSCIELPPALAPDFRVFTRSEHGSALIEAQRIHRGGDPWRAAEGAVPDL